MSAPLPVASISIQNDPHLTGVSFLFNTSVLFNIRNTTMTTPCLCSLADPPTLCQFNRNDQNPRSCLLCGTLRKTTYFSLKKRLNLSIWVVFSAIISQRQYSKGILSTICLLCQINFNNPLIWPKPMIDWNMFLLLAFSALNNGSNVHLKFTDFLMHVSHACVWISAASHLYTPNYRRDISISPLFTSMDPTLGNILKSQILPTMFFSVQPKQPILTFISAARRFSNIHEIFLCIQKKK
jgi:hypothetical protein